MSSETVTRNDLTTILNTLLPFSFTDFRYHEGSVSVPTATLTSVHSETFEDGSWLILTTLIPQGNGSPSTVGQNRINVNGTLVTAHKDIADTSLSNLNFYVLESANNATVTLEAYQATGNSQTQTWRYVAIRIGDKFAQAEADYVVEEGTSGIWTYRKWNSGIAECWGFQTQTCPLSSAYGSAYYTAVAPFCTFPTGLFISNPTVNTMRTGGVDGGGLIAVSIYGINTSSCSAYVWNTLSGSLTMTFSIHAIGRWK